MLIEFAVSFAEVRRDSFPVVAIPAVDLVSATDDCPRSPPPVRSNTALEPEATTVVRGGQAISAVDSVSATDDQPLPDVVAVDDDTPTGFTPPRPVPPLLADQVTLEDFVSNVTKVIPPPRRRRVDPVLVDAPPQLPSSVVLGLRRSHHQALNPLSAVKPAKRGAVLLMRRLSEVGAPPPLAASTEEAVDKLFREAPPPH
jgi:hypothetical protein